MNGRVFNRSDHCTEINDAQLHTLTSILQKFILTDFSKARTPSGIKRSVKGQGTWPNLWEFVRVVPYAPNMSTAALIMASRASPIDVTALSTPGNRKTRDFTDLLHQFLHLGRKKQN